MVAADCWKAAFGAGCWPWPRKVSKLTKEEALPAGRLQLLQQQVLITAEVYNGHVERHLSLAVLGRA